MNCKVYEHEFYLKSIVKVGRKQAVHFQCYWCKQRITLIGKLPPKRVKATE